MLAGAMFYAALIALTAAMILSAGLAMTRATIARMAQPYLAGGYQRALSSLQTAVAAQVRAGVPYPAPAFTPLPPACANASCTYTAGETITLTTAAAPTPGPSCDPASTNCAPNVQTNAYVRESRVTALITVEVRDASGAVAARRSAAVVLRTLDAPPYALLAGTRENAFDDVAGAHAAGDDGGAPPASPNPCVTSSPGVAGDTAVRVAYRNRTSGACSDGGSWANASYDASE